MNDFKAWVCGYVDDEYVVLIHASNREQARYRFTKWDPGGNYASYLWTAVRARRFRALDGKRFEPLNLQVAGFKMTDDLGNEEPLDDFVNDCHCLLCTGLVKEEASWIQKKTTFVESEIINLIQNEYEATGKQWPSTESILLWVVTELGEVIEQLMAKEGIYKRNHPEKKEPYSKERFTEEIGDAIFGLLVAGINDGFFPISAMVNKMQMHIIESLERK